MPSPESAGNAIAPPGASVARMGARHGDYAVIGYTGTKINEDKTVFAETNEEHEKNRREYEDGKAGQSEDVETGRCHDITVRQGVHRPQRTAPGRPAPW